MIVTSQLAPNLGDTVSDASLILFTTTTLDPYLADAKLFERFPTVLHLSLRDICVNVILASQNIVDDVEHGLNRRDTGEQTSCSATYLVFHQLSVRHSGCVV